MASGQAVVQILKELPPGTLFAQILRRAGGSAPVEGVMVWAFDAATVEYMDFLCLLHGYGGGGLTFTLGWSATTATTGNVVWSIGVRRMADDAEDIDTAQTYDYNNSAAVTTATVNGEVVYDTITFTDGADMDSWATGEMAIVRVRRFATDSGDTLAGDAEMWMLAGKET